MLLQIPTSDRVNLASLIVRQTAAMTGPPWLTKTFLASIFLGIGGFLYGL